MHINKVAVAGATGFVGTAIIDSLLKKYSVRGLTRSEGKISQATKNDPVEWVYCDVHSSDSVNSLLLENVLSKETLSVSLNGLFVAIGHDPATSIFKGKIELDEQDYIKVDKGTTRTSVPGIFAAGDCVDKIYRQAVTAAGMGCMAALDAEKWLAAKN